MEWVMVQKLRSSRRRPTNSNGYFQATSSRSHPRDAWGCKICCIQHSLRVLFTSCKGLLQQQWLLLVELLMLCGIGGHGMPWVSSPSCCAMLRHTQFAQVDRDISIFFTFANLTCSQAVRNGNGPCPWWKHWPAFSHQLYTPHLSQNIDYRRKFRSQTSDNTDRWNSRGGKSQRREEKKKEDDRRERVRRKKMQMREKVEKSRNTVFFQCFAAPESRKVGSLKRRVRSHVARWEIKSCTPLWRAHVQVKMHKTHQRRSTLGSWHIEKVHAMHAVVAWSRSPSQNAQSTSASDHFWKLRCRKSARRCGTKHISKSKCTKHHMLAPLWRFRCRFAWQAQGIVHLAKSEKNVRVL